MCVAVTRLASKTLQPTSQYKRETGGAGIEDTLKSYSVLAALAGFTAGAIGRAYVANEAMEWVASDAPTGLRYAVDGLTALVIGRQVAEVTGSIGLNMGVNKVKKVLSKKD